MRANILKFILVFFFLLTNIEIGWTKNNPKTEEQPAYISQTDTQKLKKHTVDESVFISREKLAIHNILANTQKLGQFQTLELTINLSATYDNPFNPDDINVEGHFISPNEKHIVIPGFFYQEYERDRVSNTERLTLKDNPCFKVRFAAKDKGRWQYFITVYDRTGQIKSEIQDFEIVEAVNPGYIRRSKQSNYLEFDSGKPYFAVGQSVGWARRNRQTYDYDYFFGRLAENKGNYSRIWMVPWHLGLEWTDKGWPKGKFYGLGKYCLENAWRLDYILKLAEEKGIYVMLTLGNYGDLMQEEGIWNEQSWEYNPYNIANGGPCEEPWDFFYQQKAKDYYKKRLRYIIGRWGYSPNLLSFELFNEVDAPEEWVREMAKFIKDNDPFGHMVTISFGYLDWLIKHPEEEKIWQLPEIDYTQLHIWGKQDKPQDLIAQLVGKTITQTKSFRKPCLIAEFGIDSSKDDRFYDKEGRGLNLHNGLWSTTMSGSFGGAVNWWWDSYVEPNNLYYQYRALANFVEGVNWSKEWTLAKVSFLQKRLLDKKIRILGLTTDDEAILWIQNKESNWYSNYQGLQPPTLKNFSFYLLGLSDNNYKLEWWDTWNGEIVKETKASCINGKLLIRVPQVKSDLAIKIKKIAEDAILNPQISLLGPFAKTLFSLNNENNIILTPQAVLAINTLSAAYNGLTLEIDVDALVDTSKGIPQLKGYGFKEVLSALYKAKEDKEIPEDLHIRLINLNPHLDKTKIVRALGLQGEWLKGLLSILEVFGDYRARGIEHYLIPGSIRVVFEDNLKYWGNKVDVLVRRGKESETLSSLGLIVASLAKEPKFYEQLPKELKEYIVAKSDEKGNIELDDEGKIKQLIFKPIEKTKVDTQYLEQLDKANKELEGMV